MPPQFYSGSWKYWTKPQYRAANHRRVMCNSPRYTFRITSFSGDRLLGEAVLVQTHLPFDGILAASSTQPMGPLAR